MSSVEEQAKEMKIKVIKSAFLDSLQKKTE